jgi:glyoxylase-like metal-dependent hydrolase (beta-lactamase superfamily II)
MNRSWQIGKVRVSRVIEIGGIPSPVTFLFPEGTPELVLRHRWLRPHFATDEGRTLGSVHCFLIESQGRRIAVDTCIGNDKPRALKNWNMLQTPFLENIARAGFPPESIDTVLCTHLHVDHVGWNTRWVDGKWVPTFPNARYLFGRREWEHWSTEAKGTEADVMTDSVRPIVDAGLSQLVEMDHRITDEVWLEPTPGHTPGHVSVHIASEGREAVITGDLMHHPIQCCEPLLASGFDTDREAARRTRRAFLERYGNTEVMILGTHFAPPTSGWFVEQDGAWRFDVNAPGAR